EPRLLLDVVLVPQPDTTCGLVRSADAADEARELGAKGDVERVAGVVAAGVGAAHGRQQAALECRGEVIVGIHDRHEGRILRPVRWAGDVAASLPELLPEPGVWAGRRGPRGWHTKRASMGVVGSSVRGGSSELVGCR